MKEVEKTFKVAIQKNKHGETKVIVKKRRNGTWKLKTKAIHYVKHSLQITAPYDGDLVTLDGIVEKVCKKDTILILEDGSYTITRAAFGTMRTSNILHKMKMVLKKIFYKILRKKENQQDTVSDNNAVSATSDATNNLTVGIGEEREKGERVPIFEEDER